jgi:hypothetical protein
MPCSSATQSSNSTFLNVGLRNLTLAAELGHGCCQRLLGLRIERGIFDQAIDKHKHVLLYNVGCQRDVLVLFAHGCMNLLCQHVCNVVYVRATTRRANAIDETDLIGFAYIAPSITSGGW